VVQARSGKQRKGELQPSNGPEKAFGQALREWRKKRGIAQDELAFQCGFDRTYISLLERGIRSPTLRTIIKLCRQLDVRPSVLVRRVERVLDCEAKSEKRK
jgi:transcriptional regulator with XRE-family HTH domain